MRSILPELLVEYRSGRPVVVASVIDRSGSSPVEIGTAMLVIDETRVVGSLSGGCVEADVVARALEVLVSGASQIQRYGISDDEAFSVGLTCGGLMEVLIERVDVDTWPDLPELAAEVESGRPVAVARIVEHPKPSLVGRHHLVRPGERARPEWFATHDADASAVRDMEDLLAMGRSATLRYGPEGERLGDGIRVAVASHAPRPRLLVFGATNFAAALVRQASFAGYRVTVCDPRSTFVTPDRMPDADEIVHAWPARYVEAEAAAGRIGPDTVIAVLAHDPKIELPLLEVALDIPDVFVGAMGSRESHQRRIEALRTAGLDDEALSRLHSPLGLDLGGRSPEETAISMIAQIVARRHGGSGRPLLELNGAIHRD